MLDSELKGSLESPSDYFLDEENISADEKLDLVMMINGWRKYFWDEFKNYFRKPLPGWADVGLTIKGEVKTLWGEKPLENATVELGPFSSQFLILKDTTDKSGKFSFSRLYLRDSALIMMNAKNRKDKNNNVDIFYESTPVFNSIVPVSLGGEIYRATPEIEIPEEFDRSAYYRYVADREFNLAEGSILLKEVEIKEKLKTPANITGYYGFPTRSYTLADADRERYPDVLKYLEIEVPGILDFGDGIRIGFASKAPTIVVDGYDPAVSIEQMSMDDIAKIEIIPPSRAFPSFSAINRAGEMVEVGAPSNSGGVISILTKTGFGKFNDEFKRIIHGRITPILRGFRQAREFYSPVYPLAEKDSVNRPDQRPTLYWNPDVALENDEADIEFFTSDMPGKYMIIVEGISKKGKICYGTNLFTVDVRREPMN